MFNSSILLKVIVPDYPWLALLPAMVRGCTICPTHSHIFAQERIKPNMVMWSFIISLCQYFTLTDCNIHLFLCAKPTHPSCSSRYWPLAFVIGKGWFLRCYDYTLSLSFFRLPRFNHIWEALLSFNPSVTFSNWPCATSCPIVGSCLSYVFLSEHYSFSSTSPPSTPICAVFHIAILFTVPHVVWKRPSFAFDKVKLISTHPLSTLTLYQPSSSISSHPLSVLTLYQFSLSISPHSLSDLFM